jgi:N-acetylmuramoyl-L-alanine amidase
LLLAQELQQELLRAGFKVVTTRTSDTFVELPTRPEIARKRGADVFISLHFNAAEHSQGAVQGSEVYCLTPAGAFSTNGRGEGGNTAWCAGNRLNNKNILLAYHLQKGLVRDIGVEDRGVRRARWAVLRDATMPAVLVEAGFMSHPVEGRKIFSASYRHQLAQSIVKGLISYKTAVESSG